MNVFDKSKRHQVVNDLKIFLQDKLEYLKGNLTEFSNHLVDPQKVTSFIRKWDKAQSYSGGTWEFLDDRI